MYFKSLILTNISSDYIKVKNLLTKSKDGVLFMENEINQVETLNFPEVLISPGQSVLIPIGAFLSNFEEFETTAYFSNFKNIPSGQFQTIYHGKMELKKEIEFIGKNYIPEQIEVECSNVNFHQDIHRFNFNNTYWIDRHWGYGSCPHLFFRFKDGKVKYQGEILDVSPNSIQIESFKISNDSASIIIAELEQETTHIEYIKVNGTKISGLIILEEGQNFEFPVQKNDAIEIKGWYTIKSDNYEKMPILKKEALIENYKNYA